VEIFKFAAALNLLQNLNPVRKPKAHKFTVKSKRKSADSAFKFYADLAKYKYGRQILHS